MRGGEERRGSGGRGGRSARRLRGGPGERWRKAGLKIEQGRKKENEWRGRRTQSDAGKEIVWWRSAGTPGGHHLICQRCKTRIQNRERYVETERRGWRNCVTGPETSHPIYLNDFRFFSPVCIMLQGHS